MIQYAHYYTIKSVGIHFLLVADEVLGDPAC